MTDEQIAELITRRRRQILVHSIIYYKFNDNIISDSTWSAWAMELADLQRKYPEIAATLPYSEAYSDFDGSSGYHLPLDDPWGVRKALYLIELRNKELKGE